MSVAIEKWKKAEKYFYRFSVKLSLKGDGELVQWVLQKPNRNAYFRRLILEDMNRTRKENRLNSR